MGNEKWSKVNGRFRFSIGFNRLRYHCAVLILTGLLSFGPLTADTTTGIRVMPGYYHPADASQMKFGIGGTIAFDLRPLDFLDVFVQGEYINMSLQNSNVQSVSILDGSLGTGLRWRVNDSFSLGADLTAGLYSASWKKPIASGISAGLRATVDLRFSPVLGATLHGGFKHFALNPKPFLNTFTAGLSLAVNLSEAFNPKTRITGKVGKQSPVFPVLYSWYDDNGFAEVTVTNHETETITDCRISFYLERYMGQPKICSTVARLKPGESVDVPITAFFNETMLELNEKVTAEAKVIVEYRRLGIEQKAEIPVSFPVFHRNAMSWEDDRRAAAFVSARDPAALWFSKYTSGIVAERFRGGMNRNIQYAMGLFEALNVYGINYVIDPSSSYAEIAADTAAIDFLQYPYQTLMYRAGDCDDLSILYCSLLEAVGIDTAFLTIPGHIYTAFSTGLTEAEAKKVFYSPDQFIYADGMAWVPVEITLIKEGFNKAWRIGAKEWNDSASRGSGRILPMKKSWDICKPVSIRGAASRFALPDETRTVSAFDSSLTAWTEREIRPQVRSYEALLAKGENAEIRNRLGVLYAEYGMFNDAKREFNRASLDGDTDAWINLGNLLFIEQHYKEALAFYSHALSVDPKNSLALLGSARCYYELEEFLYSDSLYAELANSNPALSARYAYLSSFFDARGRAWSFSDRLSTTRWSIPGDKAPVPQDEPVLIALGPREGGLSSMLSPTNEVERIEIAAVPVMSPMPIPEIVLPGPESDDLAYPAPLPLIAALPAVADSEKPVADAAASSREDTEHSSPASSPAVHFETRASRLESIILAEDPDPVPETIPSVKPPIISSLPLPEMKPDPESEPEPEPEPVEESVNDPDAAPVDIAVPADTVTFAEALLAAVNRAMEDRRSVPNEITTSAAPRPVHAAAAHASFDPQPVVAAEPAAGEPIMSSSALTPDNVPEGASNIGPDSVPDIDTGPTEDPSAAAGSPSDGKPVSMLTIIFAGAASAGIALFTRFRLRLRKRGQGKKS